MGNASSEPTRILVFIHMVTVAEKTINDIIKRYPGGRITPLLRYDARREHIQNHPSVDSFILYKNVALNPFDLLKGRLAFIKEIREKRFHMVVIPDKRLKSCAFSLCAKADEKWVYDVDKEVWERFSIVEFTLSLLRRIGATLFGPVFFVLILVVILLWGGLRAIKRVFLRK